MTCCVDYVQCTCMYPSPVERFVFEGSKFRGMSGLFLLIWPEQIITQLSNNSWPETQCIERSQKIKSYLLVSSTFQIFNLLHLLVDSFTSE